MAFAGTRRFSSEFSVDVATSCWSSQRPLADFTLVDLRWIDEWTSEDSVAAIESIDVKNEAPSTAEIRRPGYEVSYST